MKTHSLGLVRILLLFAREEKLDLPALTEGLALEGWEQRADEERIPQEVYQRLWQRLTLQSADPMVHLKVARSFPHQGQRQILGLLLLKSENGQKMLQRLCRYHDLMSEGLTLRLVELPQTLALMLKGDSLGELDAILKESFALILTKSLEHLSGGLIQPASIEFRHAGRGPSKSYLTAFGLSPRFEAEEDRLLFDKKPLLAPLQPKDPGLLQALESHARALLSQLEYGQGMTGRVKRELARSLGEELPDLPEVARRLGMGPRSLQGRLKEEKTGFRKILDQTRAELAQDWLERGELSLGEIALLLGFAEQSAFSRAFLRWYGKSPKDWQRAQSPL